MRDSDLLIPNTSSSSSMARLSNSEPLSVWKTSMSNRGSSKVAKAALTKSASLRSPHEWPTISRL